MCWLILSVLFLENFLTFNFLNYLKRSFNQFSWWPENYPPPPLVRLHPNKVPPTPRNMVKVWVRIRIGGNLPRGNFPTTIFTVSKKLCRNLYIHDYTCTCIYDIHVYPPVYNIDILTICNIVRTNINQETGVAKITKDYSCN